MPLMPVFIFMLMTYINAELIINHAETWLDDFAFDRTGQNGWNIPKISGYNLPNPNPMVNISNIPKYHGPFPARYNMERYIQCNTTNDTRLFVSILTSYCNTDRRDDILQFNMYDPSNTFIMETFPKYLLNHRDKQLNSNDLPYVQNATAIYYTNHSSSNSSKPQCSDQSVYDATTIPPTNAPTTHLLPGQWYTTNTFKSYELTIWGGHIYQIVIEMILSGDMDEYIVISNIAALCIQINVPTIAPTDDPTINPAISPTNNPTIAPITASPTTWMPTIGPTEVTVNPTIRQGSSSNPTSIPSIYPTKLPITAPTHEMPSVYPTVHPSISPTKNPTIYPTENPTVHPSISPTGNPSIYPTMNPSINPSISPTKHPSVYPTVNPSINPSITPTKVPTLKASFTPTQNPSLNPSNSPTISPFTNNPTMNPTVSPSIHPSFTPTVYPSNNPSTLKPTINATQILTQSPSNNPSTNPSFIPTIYPSTDTPTKTPTFYPITSEPTPGPTSSPIILPTTPPTINPSSYPSINPSSIPSINPSLSPSSSPTVHPSSIPSSNPSIQPTLEPTETTEYNPFNKQTKNTENILLQSTSSLIKQITNGPINRDPLQEPWCYHCAMYIIIASIVLASCFILLICISCIIHRKRRKKAKKARKRLHGHMKSRSRSYSFRPPLANKEIDQVIADPDNDIGDAQQKKYIDIDVDADDNIMRYDEMNEVELQHPDHKRTMSNYHETKSYLQNGQEQEGSTGSDRNEDEEDDIHGIDGLNDDDGTPALYNNNNADDASYDHLNQDEIDINNDIDMSDSRY